MFEWRKSPAAAVRAIAQAAGQTDADLGAFEVEAVGVGELLCVRDTAAHCHDLDRSRFAPACRRSHYGAGEAKVGGAVG